jgi:hypothetical protein
VQVCVPAVPVAAPADDLLGRVLRAEGSTVWAEFQCDRDRAVKALLADLVWAKHRIPGPFCYRSRKIARSGFHGADGELGAEPTRPATKASSPMAVPYSSKMPTSQEFPNSLRCPSGAPVPG